MKNAMMIKNIYSNKLTKDIFWNLISLVVLAIGGLLINFIIGYYYNPNVLGVFNQVFAIYIMFSQFGTLGAHSSVVKYIPEYKEDEEQVKKISTSALILVIISGIISSLTLLLFSSNLRGDFWSEAVVIGIKYVSPGILFFSVNKLLLGILNGRRCMFEYALFQSIRYVLMLISLILFIIFKANQDLIPLLLTLSELTLMIVMIIFCFTKNMFGRFSKMWFKMHFKFGSKIMFGGIVAEFNTRVDVLFLGVLYNDYIVGIYSFALIFADGFYQIYMVIRKNFNPIFSEIISKKDYKKFYNIKKFIRKYVYLIMIIVAILIIIIYSIICKYIAKPDYMKGFIPLLILILSIILVSEFVIYGDILSQAGYPGWQTILNVLTVCSNIILNSIFIPIKGMSGAAIATGLSYIFNSIYIKTISKKKLRLYL